MTATLTHSVWDTEERRELRALVRRFTEREIVPSLAAWEDAGAMPRSLHARAGDLGLLALGFPEAAGGEGGHLDSAIATEELTPLLAGVAIAEERLPALPALVVMAVGGWVATALIYVLGRWRGRWVRRRFPRAGRAIKGLLRATRRRPLYARPLLGC